MTYYSFRELLAGGTQNRIAAIALVLFLCSESILVATQRIFPAGWLELGVDKYILSGILGLLLVLYYLQLWKSRSIKMRVWPLYLLMGIFMGGSLLLHPEYIGWFNHERYGVVQNILLLPSAVYAVLFFSLSEDRKQLFSALIFASKLNFLFYMAQFIHAQLRGYWTGTNSVGASVRLSYSLTFGYRVVICAILGLALLIFSSRKKLLSGMFTLLSLIMILLSGSRGAMLPFMVAALVFVVFWIRIQEIPLQSKWKRAGGLLGGLVLLIGAARLFFAVFPGILKSSRTLQSLFSGEFLAGNGRARIWKLAWNAIEKEGVLGYGFYGDRYTIGGPRLYYGYAHNIALEWIMQFGKILGILLLLLLIYAVADMIRREKDVHWHILLMTMLACCSKLLLSDSFWYYWPFWGLLAVLLAWNRQSGAAGFVWLKKVFSGKAFRAVVGKIYGNRGERNSN